MPVTRPKTRLTAHLIRQGRCEVWAFTREDGLRIFRWNPRKAVRMIRQRGTPFGIEPTWLPEALQEAGPPEGGRPEREIQRGVLERPVRPLMTPGTRNQRPRRPSRP